MFHSNARISFIIARKYSLPGLFLGVLKSAITWKQAEENLIRLFHRKLMYLIYLFQVYLDFLTICLSRRHFISSGSKSVTNERHLSALSDAFCAAYSENDCVTLKICIDFIQELSEDLIQQRDQLREALMNTIKQLFANSDFAEGKVNKSYG